jgi:hypothetical protein
LIKKQQNEHIVEMSTTLTVLFNIFTDAQFHCAKIASDKATFWSFGDCLKRSIKEFDVLSIEEE